LGWLPQKINQYIVTLRRRSILTLKKAGDLTALEIVLVHELLEVGYWRRSVKGFQESRNLII